MNVTINNNNAQSPSMTLLASKVTGNSIGLQLKESDERIKACLDKLRADSARVYSNSKALPLIKHTATNNKYSISNDEKTAFNLNAKLIYPLLNKELNNASSSDKALLANASIMLLKQADSHKMSQQQVFDLTENAGEMQKVDAYISLLSVHNQSNANVVDRLLPAPLASSFRNSEPLSADGLDLLELSVISSRAYQAEPNQIKQLFTQMSLVALDYYGNNHANGSFISALAFKQVSGNYLPLACSSSIGQNDAYAATQVLTDDKGLLSSNHKGQSTYKRDMNNMLSLLSHSSDAEMMLNKIASSGVFDKTMMKQVYEKLLTHNDSTKNKSVLSSFVENINLSDDSLDSTDVLEMYNMALSHKYNQPTKQLLDTLASRADELAAIQEDMPTDDGTKPDVDDNVRQLRQLHSVYGNNHKTVKEDTTHAFSQYTNITLKTEDAYGEKDDLMLADFNSPAQLVQALSDKQVSDILLDDSKSDIISVDIKNALKDYLEKRDNRLNLYMTKPISESLAKVADTLNTDEHHLSILLGTRQPSKSMPIASDTLQNQDMTIKLSAKKNDMSFPVSDLSSSNDFSDKISEFSDRYKLDENESIDVTASSKKLNSDFLQHVTATLSDSLKEHDNKSQDCSANIELDKLLCLPVTTLSDKIETNTIFNTATPESPIAAKSEVRNRL